MVNIDAILAKCESRVNGNLHIYNDRRFAHTAGMTIDQTRIYNLRLLIAEFGTAAEIARRADTNASYLSQVLTSVKSSTGKARGIGSAVARKIEAGCGKPKGWMDEKPDSDVIEEDQRKILVLMQRMSDEDRMTLFKVGSSLAKERRSVNIGYTSERRKQN
jgi:hypothetical protein